MFAMFLVSLVAALVLCCLLFPSMWATMACDEILDAHEAGLALVSTRKGSYRRCTDIHAGLTRAYCALREPRTRNRAAGLHGEAHHVEAQGAHCFSPSAQRTARSRQILLRRVQLNQSTSKRRSCNVSHARQAVFNYSLAPARPPRNSWRLGRAHGKQSYY